MSKTTNMKNCEKWFPHLRVLGDFSAYTFSTEEEKQKFFSDKRRNGLDDSVQPFSVGGSDAGPIHNEGYCNSAEIAERIKHPVTEVGENVLFETGHLAEPIIRNLFKKASGMEVIQWDVQVVNPKYPHCIANIDGLILCDDGKKGIYEGKCIQNRKSQWEWISIPKKEPKEAERWKLVPTKAYLLQCWFYMAVYEVDFAILCAGGWGFQPNDLVYVVIPRLPEEEETLLMKNCENFVDAVANDVFPLFSGTEDAEKYLKAFSNWYEAKDLSLNQSFELPPEAEVYAKKVLELKNEVKKINKNYKELISPREKELAENQAKLSNFMGEEIVGKIRTDTGDIVVSASCQDRHIVDKTELKTKHPDVYKECEKTIQIRSINVYE